MTGPRFSIWLAGRLGVASGYRMKGGYVEPEVLEAPITMKLWASMGLPRALAGPPWAIRLLGGGWLPAGWRVRP